MTLGRALASGCQPLLRASLSVPTTAARVAVHSLRRSFSSKQHLTGTSFNYQRTTGFKTRDSARTLTTSSLVEQVQEKNKKFPVLVYSKTWCPYCAQVKGLFSQLKVEYTAIELDEVVEGDAVQDALEDLTHRRTVPQVFVNGEFIGGCDDTLDAYDSGALGEKLAAAGFPVAQ